MGKVHAVKQHETWLLPVYGERASDSRCNALVWDVYPSTKKYLLACYRRFCQMLEEDPSLRRMAYEAVPATVQWVDAEHYDIIDLVPTENDAPTQVRIDAIENPLCTDYELLYVMRDVFYFRTSLADTTEWYEAVMPWETLRRMFKS